jgi:predicted metal-dependent HD superfamily phosphohydrolase
MNLEGASQFILQKLENELPKNLAYHNLAHTKEVHEAAMRIGKEENITEKEMELLRIAALYHDSGWIYNGVGHEAISCEIVRKHLPDYGFNTDQIESICTIIMATKLPYTPENILQKIIMDADLDYLGTDTFFPRAESLRQELVSLGKLAEGADWNKLQVPFIENHHYFTASSIKNREPKKNENLELLRKSIRT